MDIDFGNARDVDPLGSGWFVGFSDWAKDGGSNLRHMPIDGSATGLCVKWFMHDAGHPNGERKPISEGRTLCILVGLPSEFRIDLSLTGAFESAQTVTRVLRQPGDFVVWGAGIHHRAFGVRPACVMTIRWAPQTASSVAGQALKV